MPSTSRGCRCHLGSNSPDSDAVVLCGPGLKAMNVCSRSYCQRCCTVAGSSNSPACLPDQREPHLRLTGACDAESVPCCRRILNRLASGCTSKKMGWPTKRLPCSATASRSKNFWTFKQTETQNLRATTRPSLAASVVLENQRSSIPPRSAPIAYKSVDST